MDEAPYITMKEPVVAEKSEIYLAVLRDARDVVYFWNLDGTYDGCDHPDEVEVT